MDFAGNVTTEFTLGSGGNSLYVTPTLNPGNADNGPSTITIDVPGGISGNLVRVAKIDDVFGGGNYLSLTEVYIEASNQPAGQDLINIPQMANYNVLNATLLRNGTSVPFSQDGDVATLDIASVQKTAWTLLWPWK